MTIMISLFIFFALFYLAAVSFLYFGLRSIKSKNPESEPYGRSFSVVIATRNEENNIENCLRSVLNQTIDTNRYEIIVINDRSTDSTFDKISAFVSQNRNMTLIDISETPPGISPKKHAVSKGISVAKNDVIVCTDADCAVPPTWLETIDRYFSDDTGLVQGITSYVYLDGMNRLFYGIQAVDFLSHGIVSAAGIGAGMPINSNANNLAFSKKAFDELGGYGTIGNVVSGDDDLLLQKMCRSKKWKIHYSFDVSGAVSTLPTKTASGVYEQRKRWGSKTVHYNSSQIAFLSGIFLFYISVLVSFGLMFFNQKYILVFLAMSLVKLIGESILMWPGAKMFNRLDLRKYIIPGSIVQLPLVIFAVFSGVMGKFVWKEQKFSRTVSVNK